MAVVRYNRWWYDRAGRKPSGSGEGIMGIESEAAQVLDNNPADGVGETVSEEVSASQGTDAPGQASPQSPSDDTTTLADAATASDDPKDEQPVADEYANQALEILASINKQLTPSASPPAAPQGKDAPAPSGSADKAPALDADDLDEILKTAREDFGDELPDKVLKPLAEKLEARFVKRIEPIMQYAKAKMQEESERQAKEQDQVVESALKTLYETSDAAIKQAIGPSYQKASKQQQAVVKEIFATAEGLMIAGQKLGKTVATNDAVKQAVSLAGLKIRSSDSYKAAQQRNRARTVASPNARSSNPTIVDEDKDRAEALDAIARTLGRK